jgi:hypothetical protein
MMTLALTACGRVGYDPLTDPLGPDAAMPEVAIPIPEACAPPVRLAAAPEIDGVVDAALTLAPLPVAGWSGPGSAPPPRHRASYALGWRDDALYLVVAVTDAHALPPAADHEVWCGAGVELYVDHDGAYRDPDRFDDAGAVQVTVAAPPAGAAARRAQRFCAGCTAAGPTATRAEAVAARAVDGGYVAEILVTAAELGLPSWPLGPGSRVGFDVAINVSTDARPGTACVANTPDQHGARLGQYFLKVGPASASPFETYQAFCGATLSD